MRYENFKGSLRNLFINGAFALLAVSAASSAQAVEKIKLGTVNWIGYSPFYVAEKLDLYKQYGVQVSLQFFSDPSLVPPGVASGALDGATFTYDQVLGGVAQGLDYKVVMPIDFSNGGDAIVASTSIKSVADFKGQTVGFSRLSAADFLLHYALEQN